MMMTWLMVLLVVVVGSFRAGLYLRGIFWGKLLFKETVSHKLPVDFTKSFEVAGYKHARFIVRSPYVSLLSFTEKWLC